MVTALSLLAWGLWIAQEVEAAEAAKAAESVAGALDARVNEALSPAEKSEVRGEALVQQLVGRLLGSTPLESDLQELTDEIGGRPTGSAANLEAVEWAVERFQEAGVEVRREAFTMPALWLEGWASARVVGDVELVPRVAAMPFSAGTPEGGLEAPLVLLGEGGEADFDSLGERARGAFLLAETELLGDLDDLFAFFPRLRQVEDRALEAGALGIVWISGRPSGQLYRLPTFRGEENPLILLAVERDSGTRLARLLRNQRRLRLRAEVSVDSGGSFTSYNVVAEIPGSAPPEEREVVVVGAHLDSWDLGTGALDNGANVALVIDVARQMRALGLQPRRTIRFALWNGEEQGFFGSWGYVKEHAAELDRHVMASSYDIGSGRISGFFTGGRPAVAQTVERALESVAALGPFTIVDAPVVGTDNYDFMLQGIGNLVALQESANYAPNYHAGSDTFDKVDLRQVHLNAAIAAAVTWAFANEPLDYQRQSAEEVEALVEGSDLGTQMRNFFLYEGWRLGERGLLP
ncbi:MAG: M20/M25/M40 family metallo-hydrolase [Acidobacteriota bacterium]